MSTQRFFVLTLLVLYAPATLLLLLMERGDLVLWISRNYRPELGYMFKYLTYLGDGWAFVPVLAWGWTRGWRHAVILILIILLQTALVQGAKRYIFDHERPKKVYGSAQLTFTPGVKMYGNHSFPSGHTATAFSIATYLGMLLVRRKHTVLIIMVLAALAGLSRVYLMQHFYVDIYFGGLVGSLSSFLVIFAAKRYISPNTRGALG